MSPRPLFRIVYVHVNHAVHDCTLESTCSVGRVVIVAVHMQERSTANGNLSHVRHEVVRRSLWILPDQATLVCSDRVEIPQEDDVPFLRKTFEHIRALKSLVCVCFCLFVYLFRRAQIATNLFNEVFRFAVRVCAFSNIVIFVHW